MDVKLTYAESVMVVNAKVDPGSSVCLFTNEIGIGLGIPIEQGIPKRLGGLTGSIEAYGHEVILHIGDIVFPSLVYFAKYPGLERNLLGRQGCWRNLKLGVIDYDCKLFIGPYDG
ncbi:MAG: hypothetical protein HOP19_17175 [Acidobacteria bacterium]|nr:hypothetical protein [Acidobacteriota bacterium]